MKIMKWREGKEKVWISLWERIIGKETGNLGLCHGMRDKKEVLFSLSYGKIKTKVQKVVLSLY